MSQNYMFNEEKDLVLMTGWDKPMGEAYIIIGQLNEAGDDWLHPLLLDEVAPFDREHNMQYVDEIVVRFSGVARRHGILLSKSIKEHLVKQITDNAVNVMFLHSENAPSVALDDSPFRTLLFRQ
ncbi:hypothetical protein M2404_003853 [Rheinheimera pacifica]|uniref:hypothetical protein n=1 Tax=Rheinheimera pacifica TaxID=173990 RepID=UPI002167DB0F|nr:hypothetical protein [Rheinheimera pacifica]MCS4309481.1 hypothetical protein [Rheinheimera pacifica]